MSDDSDFDDVAHGKLLQSIKAPGSIKKKQLKKGGQKKIDAASLLSHITVSRASTNLAKESLGIKGFAQEEEKEEVAETKKGAKKRKSDRGEDDVETKKKKKVVTKKSNTLVPLKDIEARKVLEGDIAFKDLKKEVGQSWGDLVQSNRVADQLIFPMVQPEGLLWGDEKKEPKLTKEEQAVKRATDIKLAKDKLNQMQRMRAIVGIQEAKNRYMKRIKSKGYHRILKREKRKQMLKEFDELVAKDPEAAHEKLAELDLQRIMERGSLKHRGQNQKFKQMLEKHASRNPEVKKLLEEHLRLGRELKQKVSAATGDESDSEAEDKGEAPTKKKSMHDVLTDAATEAASELSKSVGSALVDAFLDDTTTAKLSLAQLRAQKRKEAQAMARNITAQNVSEPLFDVESNWQGKSEKEGEKEKQKKKGKKPMIAKKSYVYDNAPSEPDYDEKVRQAVETAGVHDEERRQQEIAIDPSKFLELNTHDLTQVSSDFVEKMDEFDDEAVRVINEAFKDDDVVGNFEASKDTVKEKERVKDVDLNLAGWGNWTGPGTTERKRRKNFIIKAKEKKRRDGDKNGLIIRESGGPSEGIGKVQPRSLPFPYTRVEDYEAVLKQPLGLEWNTATMRDELCKRPVVVEAGRAILPINKKELLGEN